MGLDENMSPIHSCRGGVSSLCPNTARTAVVTTVVSVTVLPTSPTTCPDGGQDFRWSQCTGMARTLLAEAGDPWVCGPSLAAYGAAADCLQVIHSEAAASSACQAHHTLHGTVYVYTCTSCRTASVSAHCCVNLATLAWGALSCRPGSRPPPRPPRDLPCCHWRLSLGLVRPALNGQPAHGHALGGVRSCQPGGVWGSRFKGPGQPVIIVITAPARQSVVTHSV